MPSKYSWDRERHPDRPVAYQLDQFETRLKRTEQRLLQVENALRGVVTSLEAITIGGPCSHCSQSLLLIAEGQLYCPQCGYQRTV